MKKIEAFLARLGKQWFKKPQEDKDISKAAWQAMVEEATQRNGTISDIAVDSYLGQEPEFQTVIETINRVSPSTHMPHAIIDKIIALSERTSSEDPFDVEYHAIRGVELVKKRGLTSWNQLSNG